MAYPSSPEVCLESGSGLDRLIKNTEFENIQHTKAIETERERIKAYKIQLEEKKQQTIELEKSTVVLDEQAEKLHQQFAFNQENCESLKHTSTVLDDHEEALKSKLSTLKRDVEQEHTEQVNALSEYEGVWATYQEKYESREKFKLLTKKREEIQTLHNHSAQLEMQIQELEQAAETMKLNYGQNSSLASWVLQIALLRCETNHHLKAMCAMETTANALRLEISSLEDKIGEVQTLVERKEMKTKLAMQCELEAKQHQQHLEDVAMMETVSAQPPVTSNCTQPSQQSSFFIQPSSSLSCLSVSAPTTLPRPVITPLARKAQTSSFSLQPHGIVNNIESADGEDQQQQQQQAGDHNNHNVQNRQQKKVSRFLLEVPQLNRPQRSTTSHSTTPLVTPNRPQLPSISIPRVIVQQQASNPRRVAPEIQVPTLVAPSRPKLHTITQPNTASSPTQDLSTPLSVALKSSLQIRKPAQTELTRPTAPSVNKLAAQPQPLNAMLQQTNDLFQPSPPPPSPTEKAEVTAPLQDGVTDSSNVSASSMLQSSLETRVINKNGSFKNTCQQAIHDELEHNGVEQLEHNCTVTLMDTGEGSPVDAVSDMQIQKPLSSTTPTQTAAAITTTTTTTAAESTSMSTAENVEMADPSSLIPEQQATAFNHLPQDMDANGSMQSQAGPFSFYEGEMYQQPNGQPELENAFAGQFFDGRFSGFDQPANGFGGGFFSGQGTSSGDGGFFFGGSSGTSQQQPQSNGFGFFGFGGGSTATTSNSAFSFSF